MWGDWFHVRKGKRRERERIRSRLLCCCARLLSMPWSATAACLPLTTDGSDREKRTTTTERHSSVACQPCGSRSIDPDRGGPGSDLDYRSRAPKPWPKRAWASTVLANNDATIFVRFLGRCECEPEKRSKPRFPKLSVHASIIFPIDRPLVHAPAPQPNPNPNHTPLDPCHASAPSKPRESPTTESVAWPFFGWGGFGCRSIEASLRRRGPHPSIPPYTTPKTQTAPRRTQPKPSPHPALLLLRLRLLVRVCMRAVPPVLVGWYVRCAGRRSLRVPPWLTLTRRASLAHPHPHRHTTGRAPSTPPTRSTAHGTPSPLSRALALAWPLGALWLLLLAPVRIVSPSLPLAAAFATPFLLLSRSDPIQSHTHTHAYTHSQLQPTPTPNPQPATMTYLDMCKEVRLDA